MLHHLRIALKNIVHSVWREVIVSSDIRLDRPHQVIQVAMGWEDAHMHEFSTGRRGPQVRRFGVSFNDPFLDPPISEKKVTLAQLAPAKGDKFLYWYDFGDDWWHEIRVKAVGKPKSDKTPVPVCTKAVGACSPEDCGGPWGYAELLEALRDPKHECHDESREWVGDDWDVNRYGIVAVNRELACIGKRRSALPRVKPLRTARH